MLQVAQIAVFWDPLKLLIHIHRHPHRCIMVLTPLEVLKEKCTPNPTTTSMHCAARYAGCQFVKYSTLTRLRLALWSLYGIHIHCCCLQEDVNVEGVRNGNLLISNKFVEASHMCWVHLFFFADLI